MSKKKTIKRTPPAEVIKQLSEEVGYGCPIQNCGNPYLEFHHFDPTWRVRRHHEPQGMIALCSEHHPLADGGAYTISQLRNFKKHKCTDVNGRFEWRRNSLLMFVGPNAYMDCHILFSLDDRKMVWINRDSDGNLLLNIDINVPGKDYQRIKLIDNTFYVKGNPKTFSCPPSGKLIRATYENGDRINIEFIEVNSKEQLSKICPANFDVDRLIDGLEIRFPITSLIIGIKLKDLGINLNSTAPVPGITIQGNMMKNVGHAIGLHTPNHNRENANVRSAPLFGFPVRKVGF